MCLYSEKLIQGPKITVPTQKLYPKYANIFGNAIILPLLRSKAIPITFMDSTIWAPGNIENKIWALTPENQSSVFANNKSADQPVHPCRLISSFVIHFLESIISKLVTGEILIF